VLHFFLQRFPDPKLVFETESPPGNFLPLRAASSTPVEAAFLYEEAKEMSGSWLWLEEMK
jgi:hypothetical protein